MYLLFDVGGTHTRVAMSMGAELGKVERFETDPSEAGVGRLVDELRGLCRGERLQAVIGGLPGHLEAGGRLRHAPNLPGWLGRKVAGELESALDAPVVIENDAAMAGLGEAVYGAGRGKSRILYLTVSTGVNASRIIGGEIDEATRGVEIGEMMIADDAGRRVRLEQLLGGAAMQRRYGRPPAEIDDKTVWETEAHYVGIALAELARRWRPELAVLGGAMMRDIPMPKVRQLLAAAGQSLAVKPAALGDLGGLYGALARCRAL